MVRHGSFCRIVGPRHTGKVKEIVITSIIRLVAPSHEIGQPLNNFRKPSCETTTIIAPVS